jgi:hypothetical protein
MKSVLVNAKIVSTGDGYVRRISLEFMEGTRRKREQISILPGMSRLEVAASLHKAADEIDKDVK